MEQKGRRKLLRIALGFRTHLAAASSLLGSVKPGHCAYYPVRVRLVWPYLFGDFLNRAQLRTRLTPLSVAMNASVASQGSPNAVALMPGLKGKH